MPFIATGIANATFVIQRTGDVDPYTTALGLSYASFPFDTAQANSLAAAWKTAALPNLSSSDTLISVDFDYNDGPGVLSYSSVQNAVGTGQGLSSVCPQNCAALFIKRTALPGRPGRGRMFWPYVAEADSDGVGALSTTAVTRYQTMITALQAAITSNTFFDAPMLLHTTSSPVATPITAVICSPTVATQRRRLRR
jgi:hypothetical protein